MRIQTAYRLGDEAGTDLGEIAGRSGRVVLDLTVQNTTVRPEEVTYDAGGVQRSQFALVGVPLTVVASAVLGEGSLAEVVTGEEGDDDVTNGVLSRGGGGEPRVQWATMLAPPRLAPSATFRLVLDTDDFEVPSFDIGVQPGLVTDTSLTGLLDEAFSDDRGGAIDTEARTIEVIGDVTSVLTQAGAVLTDIETRLSDSAERLGAQTIADLQSSSAGVSEQLGSLSADLARLDGSLGEQLGGVQDDAVQALSSSLTEVKDVLGDPARIKSPTPQDGAEGCRVELGRDLSAPTVYGQLAAVSSRLSTLSNASGACRASIADDLARQIGSADELADCGPRGHLRRLRAGRGARAPGRAGRRALALRDRPGRSPRRRRGRRPGRVDGHGRRRAGLGGGRRRRDPRRLGPAGAAPGAAAGLAGRLAGVAQDPAAARRGNRPAVRLRRPPRPGRRPGRRRRHPRRRGQHRPARPGTDLGRVRHPRARRRHRHLTHPRRRPRAAAAGTRHPHRRRPRCRRLRGGNDARPAPAVGAGGVGLGAADLGRRRRRLGGAGAREPAHLGRRRAGRAGGGDRRHRRRRRPARPGGPGGRAGRAGGGALLRRPHRPRARGLGRRPALRLPARGLQPGRAREGGRQGLRRGTQGARRHRRGDRSQHRGHRRGPRQGRRARRRAPSAP